MAFQCDGCGKSGNRPAEINEWHFIEVRKYRTEGERAWADPVGELIFCPTCAPGWLDQALKSAERSRD